MAVAVASLRTTFQALSNRHYRWLWLGRLATSATFQMGGVVQGWLVYHLTGSAFALGWVGAGWSVSTLLLSPYGGVIADRVDKRNLMLWTRMGMMLNTIALGLLISLGWIQVWHIALGSFFTGIFIAFLMPAQQAIISELVEPKTLMNAMSVDALGMGMMGVVSASVAGFVIRATGAQGVYFIMAGMYVISLYTILKLPKAPPRDGERTSVWSDLLGGAHYLRGNSILLTILGLGLVRVFFVMPYHSLMPAFARDNMGFDAAGLGLLQSAAGVGALVASLIACNMGDFQGKGKLLVHISVALGFCLIAYVTVPWVPLVFVLLAIVGGLNNMYMVLNNTLLLSNTDARYRGRVLSISLMEFGLHPLGTIPSGAIADRVGVSFVVAAQGAVVAAVFALVSKFKPGIKKLP
jgi:MFS family permease